MPVKSGNLLTADPDSSSDSSSDSEDDEVESEKPSDALPNPLSASLPSARAILSSGTATSVFINPFQKAEDAKLSILEKHVKLSIIDKTATEIGGKKVCKIYRLGRCKRGHKCPNAHDGDIPIPQSDTNTDADTGGYQDYRPPGGEFFEQERPDDDNYMSGKQRKRRHGVGDGMCPPKKAMQNLTSMRNNERPWTVKK